MAGRTPAQAVAKYRFQMNYAVLLEDARRDAIPTSNIARPTRTSSRPTGATQRNRGDHPFPPGDKMSSPIIASG